MTCLSVFASIALALISHFIIKAYCIFCMGVYVVNIGMFVVALKSFAAERGTLFAIPKGTILKGLFSAVVWVVLMLVLHEPKKVEWRDFPNQEIENQLSIWRGAAKDDVTSNPQGDMSLGGSSSAKVEIVEFFDYECPACQMFSGSVREIVAKYGADVRVVLKQYPLDKACNPAIEMDMHKNACRAAEVARCAGKFGVLNSIHEALMTPGVTKEEYSVMFDRAMQLAGVSAEARTAIQSCVESGEERSAVAADIQLGDKLGLQGTPAFWVNGKRLAAPSVGLLKAILSSELGK
jgi:protein-disulfide isomerase